MAGRPSRDAGLTVVALIAIAVLALLPDLGPPLRQPDSGIQAFHGRIVEVRDPPAGEAFTPPTAIVTLLDGPQAGRNVEALVEGPGGSQTVADYKPGEEVVVTITNDQHGVPYTAVSDRWRAPLLGAFVLLFALAVVVVGGIRGVRALVSLGFTIAVILKILVPLVISGVAPVPLAVITATVVTVISIVLTEGINRAAAAAILGTAAALSVAGVLAAVGTALAGFTYTAGSDLAFFVTADGRGIDLRGMLLAAIILGAVGVLDDVTVTQAALVDSLAEHGAHGQGLIRSALRVGQSHIGATVNTLFLAYVGAGLPLVVLILVSRQPMTLILNSEEVATEVVRTIVGSLGIIAAVPFTTFIAAALLDRQPRAADTSLRRFAMPAVVVAIALALAGTALLPGSSRVPLTAGRLDPSALPLGSDGGFGPEPGVSLGPDGSFEPSASTGNEEPIILSPGETFALESGGAQLGITVTSVRASKTSSGYDVLVRVTYDNQGAVPFVVDPAAWSLITGDGESITMVPAATDGLEAGALKAGETRSGRLRGIVRATPDQTFVAFTAPDGVMEFALPANGT